MTPPLSVKADVVAFQGWHGANSDLACREVYPDLTTLACTSFEDTIRAVHDGRADLAMIPIENSVAGRVADIHRLLPDSGLTIIGEHFHRVSHQLLGLKGASLDTVTRVHSHHQALGQCARRLRRLGVEPMVAADTAGAAKMISELADPSQAAIATTLAAQLYGLDILASDIEDEEHNITRFVIMSKDPAKPMRDPRHVDPEPYLTSFVFEVQSRPAALYKALGGFATGGINIVKLESYLKGPRFTQARFYADIEGHLDDPNVTAAFEEMRHFTKLESFRILGTYPASPYRENPQLIG